MAYYRCNKLDGISSGAIANFTTPIAKPLVNLTTYFKATQEAGTPTPQSPKAIIGVSAVSVPHCHKNLYQYDASKVKTGTTTAQSIRAYLDLGLKGANQFTISAKIKDGETPTNTNINISKIRADGLIEVLFVFILSGNPTPTARTITINQGESLVFTMASDNPNTALTNIPKYDYQIEVGSNASELEPYNGTTTLINLGDTYYGGYVSQDRDGKREITVTYKIQSFSIGNWGYGLWGSRYFFSQRLLDAKPNSVSTVLANSLCEVYEQQTPSNIYTHDTIGYCINNDFIRVQDNNYNSLNDWKEAVKNYNYVYELAEPFTVALPDGEPITAFNGVNNIYNDSGDTSVQFVKSYLGKICT